MHIRKSLCGPSKSGGTTRIITALFSDRNRAGYAPLSSKFSLVDTPIRLKYNAALPEAFVS